jgi:hypothetical protein
MESHDIDQIGTPLPARAPGRRWGALFGSLGVVSLIALTLSASVAGAAPSSPTPAGTAGTIVVGGPVPAGASVPAGSSADVEKMDAAFTKYTACMREHGVEMPDPVKLETSGTLDATAAEAPAAGVTVVAGTSQALSFDPSSGAFAAADAACSSILEDAGILKATSAVDVPIEGPAGSIDGPGTAGTVVVGGAVAAGSPIEGEKVEAAFKKFTSCMREHGIEMPEPVFIEASGPLDATAATAPTGGVVTATGTSEALSFDPASEEFTAADAACSSILEDAGILTGTGVINGAIEGPAGQ